MCQGDHEVHRETQKSSTVQFNWWRLTFLGHNGKSWFSGHDHVTTRQPWTWKCCISVDRHLWICTWCDATDLRSDANAMNSAMLRQKCCDNKCVLASVCLQMHTECVSFWTPQVPTLPCGSLCVALLCVLCLDLLCVLCVDPITSCRTLYRETLLGN